MTSAKIRGRGVMLDLSKAKYGQRFRTQDGRLAKFICFEAGLHRPYVFKVGRELWTRRKDGSHCKTCNGLVYPFIVKKVS